MNVARSRTVRARSSDACAACGRRRVACGGAAPQRSRWSPTRRAVPRPDRSTRLGRTTPVRVGRRAPTADGGVGGSAMHRAPDLAAQRRATAIRRATRTGARALLKQFVSPNADHAALTRSLRPTTSDYKALFDAPGRGEDRGRAGEGLGLEQGRHQAEARARPRSRSGARRGADIAKGDGNAKEFPGGYKKKIIMVDRNNRSTMFEPGVTFDELIPAVAKKGLRLNLPLLPRKSKSVVGSLLEREPVIMPKYHWDISDPTNCFEVVFGTGDMFRTGAAAGPGTLEEQWEAGGAQKEAAGPSSSSWYRIIQGSQGTMGIVSWATARCEIIPTLEEPFLVGVFTIGQNIRTGPLADKVKTGQ